MISRILIAIGAIALATPVAATTVTLDFSGAICDTPTGACGNGSQILQSYGDVAGQVDVAYDGNRATSALESVEHWTSGYETLTNVAYGVFGLGGLSISLQALAGYEITLSSLDIAPYLNRTVNSSVTVFDRNSGSQVFGQIYNPVSTAGVTSLTFSGLTSSGGFDIWLGPDAWNVGIDNIVFSVSPTAVTPPDPPGAAIPLPVAGWLLLGGLGGLAGLRRRARG